MASDQAHSDTSRLVTFPLHQPEGNSNSGKRISVNVISARFSDVIKNIQIIKVASLPFENENRIGRVKILEEADANNTTAKQAHIRSLPNDQSVNKND